MNVLLGILYHTIGGISSGSFIMPYSKVKKWAWEVSWLMGGLFSWFIVPPIAASLTIPDFTSIISESNFNVKNFVFLMGVLWGIGGLLYGLGVKYLGMSLGNSVILGFCSTFGALVPSIYYNIVPTAGKTSFTDMFQSSGGQLVLLGVVVCLLGIGVSGKAGIMKENEINPSREKQKFSIVKGLIIATISGILSSFFNFGIEGGKTMAEQAVQNGCNPLFQNNVTYVVLLWGGLLSNFVGCAWMMYKNKSVGDYVNQQTPILANIGWSALAGTMWFLQFFFYGMGESKLGNGASSWILHMATIILTANLWGLYLKEWKGVSKKTFQTFAFGIGLIMLSIVLVGFGNSLK